MRIVNQHEIYYLSDKDNLDKHDSDFDGQKIISSFLEKLDNEGYAVLDIGCGIGNNLNALKKFENKFDVIIACDISLNAIKTAQKKRMISFFVICDCQYLPFKPNNFSVVLCTEVLEHVNDFEKATTEIEELNSKYMILSSPNYLNIRGIEKLVRDWIEDKRFWEPWGTHKEGFERFMYSIKLKKRFRTKYKKIDDRGLNYKLSWKIPRRFERFIKLGKFPILKLFGMHYYCLLIRKKVDYLNTV